MFSIKLILLNVFLLFFQREADAEADADAYFPYHAAVAPVAPLVYHAPNCTTVEETVTLKQCTPK